MWLLDYGWFRPAAKISRVHFRGVSRRSHDQVVRLLAGLLVMPRTTPGWWIRRPSLFPHFRRNLCAMPLCCVYNHTFSNYTLDLWAWTPSSWGWLWPVWPVWPSPSLAFCIWQFDTSLDSAWMLSACVTVLAGLSLFFVTLPGVIELSGGAQPVSLFIARVSVAGCDGTC